MAILLATIAINEAITIKISSVAEELTDSSATLV